VQQPKKAKTMQDVDLRIAWHADVLQHHQQRWYTQAASK
jgi:hypothetical protein